MPAAGAGMTIVGRAMTVRDHRIIVHAMDCHQPAAAGSISTAKLFRNMLAMV